jgi:hypothetical protein
VLSNKVLVIVKKSALNGRLLFVMNALIDAKSNIDASPPDNMSLNYIKTSIEALASII